MHIYTRPRCVKYLLGKVYIRTHVSYCVYVNKEKYRISSWVYKVTGGFMSLPLIPLQINPCTLMYKAQRWKSFQQKQQKMSSTTSLLVTRTHVREQICPLNSVVFVQKRNAIGKHRNAFTFHSIYYSVTLSQRRLLGQLNYQVKHYSKRVRSTRVFAKFDIKELYITHQSSVKFKTKYNKRGFTLLVSKRTRFIN